MREVLAAIVVSLFIGGFFDPEGLGAFLGKIALGFRSVAP